MPASGALRHLPVFLDIAQGQVQQFSRRFVAGKVATIFDDLSQAHMQALNGVDRVNDRAHLRRCRSMGPVQLDSEKVRTLISAAP